MKSLFGAGVVSACSLSVALAQPSATPSVPPSGVSASFAAIGKQSLPTDPALKTGVLPNGLRYALMRSPPHARQGMSIRLGFDVGSFEEAEGERGLAHFVEHMAFRSTRAFPDNAAEVAFAADGLTFGRDHNAATDLYATTYVVDLNKLEPASVERAFTWLRNVADGIVFDPVAVDRERGVVLAEKQERNGDGYETGQELLRFRAPGLRAVDRMPIGLESVLKSATPTALEGFYRRWYRPEHAVVVVVSDQPAEVVEAQLLRTFGSWTAVGPKPARAAFNAPDVRREADVLTRADGGGMTTVDVCRVQAAGPRPVQDYATARAEALRLIWRDVLNQRFSQARQNPANQMLDGEMDSWTDDRNMRMACMTIHPTNDAWKPALAVGQAELARFQVQGPTELEVENAIDRVRSRFRGAIGSAASRAGPDMADVILETLLEGQTLVDPRQRLRAYDLAVEDVTAADVHAAFRRDWSGAGPLISVVAPRAPSVDEVRTAWAAQAGASVTAYVDAAPRAAWGYNGGPRGVVASREKVATGDFVRIRFRNGVTLNFKRTRFSPSQASFVVRFGLGRGQIADRDLVTATFGGPVLPFGGVGKHAYDEIVEVTGVEVRDLSLLIGVDGFSIAADEPVNNLEGKLKVTAALLADPGFRPSMNPMLHEAAELTYRLTDSTPAMKAGAAMIDGLFPGTHHALPPRAELLAIDSTRVAAVLRPVLTQGPIDVTIVGDLEESEAIELVAASFGALTARPAAAPITAEAHYIRYPAQSPPPIRAQHTGPADKAAGQLLWPLYVATPERRREEFAISVLASIFSDELRHELRGELGKAYAPSVESEMPDHADQGVILATFESYPDDLDTLMAAARRVASRLAAGQITEAQLATARAPMLVTNRQLLASNARWAAALARSAEQDQDLRDLLGYDALVSSLRLDEIKKAAADWLTRDPIVVTATSAKAARIGAAQ